MSNLSRADKALVKGISNLVQNWVTEKVSTLGDALTTAGSAAKKRGRPKKAAKRGRPKKAVKKAAKRGRPKKAVKKAAKRGRPKKAVKKAAKRGRPKKAKISGRPKKTAKRTLRGKNLENIIKFLKTKAKGATQVEVAEATGIAAPNVSLLVKKNAGRFSKTKVGRATVVKLK